MGSTWNPPPPPKGPPPPDGHPPHGMPIDFSSRVPQILAGVLLPFTIASLFVACRLYTRAVIVRAWGLDDSLVTVSWVLGLGVTIVSCVSTRYGIGHHTDAIPPSNAVPALQSEYAYRLLYQAFLASLKCSICLFYLRLFSDRQSRFLIIGTMIWIASYFLPIEIIDMFQCSPVEGIWNKKIPSSCVNIHPCFYTMAVCNIVGDAWLITIIVPKIWPLKMARRQKIALMSVITSGWLVIVAAILRAVRITRSESSHDRSWVYYDTAIWSGLEVSVSLFCVSAPTMKPFLNKYMPGLVGSLSPSYSLHDNGYSNFNVYNNAMNNNINKNSHNNYLGSDGRAKSETATYVNSDIGQAELGLQLQDLRSPESSGKQKAQDSKTNVVTGNRTFFRKDDSDSESMEEMVPKSEAEDRIETVPMTILKSTSVTIRVENTDVSVTLPRARSESTSRNVVVDRSVGGLGYHPSGREERGGNAVNVHQLDAFM